ncbi:MAG: RNA polymerase sigma factor [Myxococcota bacterium]
MNDADRKLVDGICRGDGPVFEELYRHHFQRIYRFAIRRLGDRSEAEDVTQEVFEAVLNGIERFEGRSDLLVWIYGIARNILNSRLRRRAGARLVPLEHIPLERTPVDLGPGPRVEAREALSYVQGAIERLPADQRRMLELRHAERLGIRKIASLMNRSEDAVKSGLYRARRNLASTLPAEHARPTL